MVLLQRKLYFPKDPEGAQHFPGGSGFFQLGVQKLIYIETHMTCDFPGCGDVRTPIPTSGSAHAVVMAQLMKCCQVVDKRWL